MCVGMEFFCQRVISERLPKAIPQAIVFSIKKA